MTTAGRPRDPRVDDALRRVVEKLLIEQGYGDLTVQGVARAAGVSPATVYRRFSGKRELVEWAVFPAYEYVEPRWTGDVDADLTTLVAIVLGWLSRPAIRAAIPGLLGEYVRDSKRYDAILEISVQGIRGSLQRVVGASEVDHLLDVMLGAAVLEAMVHGADDLGYRSSLSQGAICGEIS